MEWPRHIRAGVLAVRGRHDAAAAEYRRALESDPGDPAALIALLRDCRAHGAVADAIAVANRALALDAGNYIALDGLAWAYLEQQDHHRAFVTVERALKALDALDTGAAFGGVARYLIGAVRLVLRLPGLRGRFGTLRSTSEMQAEALRGIAEWRAWALSYMAWYRQEHGSGSTGAHR